MKYSKQHIIKSSYYATDKEESALFSYQKIKINQYIQHMLSQKGILSQKIIYQLNDKYLNIIVYYYNQSHNNTQRKTTSIIKFKTRKIRLKRHTKSKNRKMKRALLKRSLRRHVSIFELLSKSKIQKLLIEKQKQKNKKYNFCRFSKVLIVKRYKNYWNRLLYRTNGILKKHVFHEHILEAVSEFTKRKYHISLIFKNINKGINITLTDEENAFLKKQSILLKPYIKRSYFKDSLNICVIGSKLNHTSNLFSTFLATHLKYLKYHKSFIFFIAHLLRIIIRSRIFVLKGVKVLVSGRINNRPRAKNVNIIIGNIPTITKDIENIDYSESTCYTKNGTLGIKVWCNHD